MKRTTRNEKLGLSIETLRRLSLTLTEEQLRNAAGGKKRSCPTTTDDDTTTAGC